jgi:hypothetical protein
MGQEAHPGEGELMGREDDHPGEKSIDVFKNDVHKLYP